MKHALSIYKFSFPFIEYRYEKAIFWETVSDFEKKLRYEEIYISCSTEDKGVYILKSIHFQGGRCDFYLSKDESYYIPKHHYELYLDSSWKYFVIHKLIEICNTLWLHNYIFDYSSEFKPWLKHKDIITEKILERDFKQFNEKKLKEFLLGVEIPYISETLKQNIVIRNSFYFMMYNCYHFYRNYTLSESQLSEISSTLKTDISEEYSGILELSSQRLKHIHDINISTFKKYSKILDNFFYLLK